MSQDRRVSLESLLDADLPRIATAIERLADEMHLANTIAMFATGRGTGEMEDRIMGELGY